MQIPRVMLLGLALAAALAGAACIDQQGNVTLPQSAALTGPSANAGSLTGFWRTRNGQPGADNCYPIQWDITNQTGARISGSFFAICANVVLIGGTASGTTNGEHISLQVSGVTEAQGVSPTCGFSLQGIGTIGSNTNALLMNYFGTTCLGPVSGEEVLRP